jgi:hypothetical protein
MKFILFLLIGLFSIVNAQEYVGHGSYTSDIKTKACSQALEFAKVEAMEQAGTLVFSNFNSAKSDNNGKIDEFNQQKLITASLGVTKLKSKDEKITVTTDYQFTCKVDATFEIDSDKMQKKLNDILEAQNKLLEHKTGKQKDGVVVNQLRDDDIKVIKVISKTSYDLLDARVVLKNNSDDTKSIEYKFIWYDEDGLEMSKSQSLWKQAYIDKNDKIVIKQLAVTSKIKSFELYLRD